jgi:N utilization substance protein A
MALKRKDEIKNMIALAGQLDITAEQAREMLKDAMITVYAKEHKQPGHKEPVIAARKEGRSTHYKLYQVYQVVNEVTDDEVEMSLEDAQKLSHSARVSGEVEKPLNVSDQDLDWSEEGPYYKAFMSRIRYSSMIRALDGVAAQNNISVDMARQALCDALATAYKKEHSVKGLNDPDVSVRIDEKHGKLDLFQRYKVVEDVEDDELEVDLERAHEIDPNAQIGDTVEELLDEDVSAMDWREASMAKNNFNQNIREASKEAVYKEYIDKKHEMVLGIVEAVRDKYVLVDIGKTIASMPLKQQNPLETYEEGQQLRVVITDVDKKAGRSSQVTVSRADADLVRRLFEKEVPEIYNGTVEIKKIAREAGERTKMAVLSNNPDVEPVGACIGPRGQRVQNVISELHGEKIDIFQYSDDINELVRNALAPAEVQMVIQVDPNENDENGEPLAPGKKNLIVVVDEKQLSLAIGKKGKNARLAVKLTGHKIDIKTKEELIDAGYDYEELEQMAARQHEEALAKAEARRKAESEKKARQEEENRRAAFEAIDSGAEKVEYEEDGFIPEEMQDAVSEKVINDMTMEEADEAAAEAKAEEEPATAETPVEEPAEETAPVEEETPAAEEPVEEEPTEKAEEEEEEIEKPEEAEPAMEKTEVKSAVSHHKHADLEEMAEKNTYVSKFEKLTDTSAGRKNDFKPKHKKRKTDEDNYKVDNKELEKQIKAKLSEKAAANKPLYTEEELAEIEDERRREEEHDLGIDEDIDEEDYDEYYDDEDN